MRKNSKLLPIDICPIDDLRTAGLVMVQGNYRIWRISIQMGGGEAQGEIMIAMRPKVSMVTAPVKDTSGWLVGGAAQCCARRTRGIGCGPDAHDDADPLD